MVITCGCKVLHWYRTVKELLYTVFFIVLIRAAALRKGETEMKFKINRNTNVRVAVDDNGKILAFFGVAADLLKANLLLEVQSGFENNVITIQAPDYDIVEHESIDDAKEYLRVVCR